MNLIPWKRFFLAVAGLLVISTVGCDPAKAQDELAPANKNVCWDHPTENVDGSSPVDDLERFRLFLTPMESQNAYWYPFDGWGVAADADENGRQCVTFELLKARFERERDRVLERDGLNRPQFGLWEIAVGVVDTSGNSPNEMPTVQMRFVSDEDDTVAPNPATNVTLETPEPDSQ